MRKNKELVIIIGVVFLFLFYSSPMWAENWKLLSSDDNYAISYDTDRVNYTSDKIIRVWVKYLFTEKGRQSFIELAKRSGFVSTDYERIYYLLLLVEFDSQAMMIRTILSEQFDRYNNRIVPTVVGPDFGKFKPINNNDIVHQEVVKFSKEKESKNTLLNTLNRIGNCMGISAAGYDCNCVFGIQRMVAEGKLSSGEAEFLISQKCKTAKQQLPQQQDCTICPICKTPGLIGPVIGGAFHYRCTMGHIWPCDR